MEEKEVQEMVSAFLIFQKEMTEKLVEMAGVTFSNTEMLGMVAERWKTLDQDLKMEYEKRVRDLKVEGEVEEKKGFLIIINGLK